MRILVYFNLCFVGYFSTQEICKQVWNQVHTKLNLKIREMSKIPNLVPVEPAKKMSANTSILNYDSLAKDEYELLLYGFCINDFMQESKIQNHDDVHQ